jgi:hypothetical protein
MATKDIRVFLRKFKAILERLKGSKNDLSPSEQQEMARELQEIYGYMSEIGRKPSIQTVLHSQAAQRTFIQNQFVKEKEQLDLHRKFVESISDKADQYLRTIQLGGYAIFFAVWGITREWLMPFWGSLAAILMIISAAIFITWEIWKSTILSLTLKQHAIIPSLPIEDFIRTRMSKLIFIQSNITRLAKARAIIWIICVIPACLSLIILVWQLLKMIINQFNA